MSKLPLYTPASPPFRSGPCFSRDIDDSVRAEPELGRQCARQKCGALDKMRVKFLAETFEAFGQHYPVDTVPGIAMFPADVYLSIGILHDAWQTQQDLLERGAVATGYARNLCLAGSVAVDSQFRGDFRGDAVLVGGLARDDNLLELGDGIRLINGGLLIGGLAILWGWRR